MNSDLGEPIHESPEDRSMLSKYILSGQRPLFSCSQARKRPTAIALRALLAHSRSVICARLLPKPHTAIVWKMYGETTGERTGNGVLELRSVVNGYHPLPSSYFRPVEIGCVVGPVKLQTHLNFYIIICVI